MRSKKVFVGLHHIKNLYQDYVSLPWHISSSFLFSHVEALHSLNTSKCCYITRHSNQELIRKHQFEMVVKITIIIKYLNVLFSWCILSEDTKILLLYYICIVKLHFKYSTQISQQVSCLFKQLVTSQSETFSNHSIRWKFSRVRETKLMMTYMQKLKQTLVMWQWKLFTEDRQLTCVILKGNRFWKWNRVG